MPPPPRFKTMQPNQGLDGQAVPVWLVVPRGGTKTIRVQHAVGSTITVLQSAVATVAEQPANPAFKSERILRITGVTAGSTFVEVKSAAGVVQGRLECCVKARKTVKAAFNFVHDTAGHYTKRAHSSVNGWVTVMNNILLPQTNIEITKNSVQNVTVHKNLGKVVRFSSHLAGVPAAQHEWGVVTALGDSTADFNVFFVWEYEQDITPNVDHTDAGTMGGNCIFEDKAGKEVGETLTHETGHYLGAADTYVAARLSELMYGITDKRGRKIRKAEANLMNP